MNEDELTRGFCRVLDSCEARPRQEIRAQRDTMIERLCRHAMETTPFYQNRLKPLFGQKDRFCIEAWPDIPPLTRSDLLEHYDLLKSDHVPKNFGKTIETASSGSTGQPVRALWTHSQMVATRAVGRRLHRWHGVDPSEFLVLVYATPADAISLETEHDYWAPVYKSLGLPGRCVVINGQLPAAYIAERLEALRPDHININPRLLFAIAGDYLSEGKMPGYTLKSIGTFGETRTHLIDEQIRRVFGHRPYSRYSADEIGHIAIECPDCRTYHVAEEITHIDVVGDGDRPAEPGAVGQILVTPLYSYAMPLIRYELGDEVRLAEETCRRSYGTSISEIHGRTGNLFVDPDGNAFRPNRMIVIELLDHLQARAVQVVQNAPGEIVVKYRPGDGIPEPERLRDASEAVRKSLGFATKVDLEPVDAIPALSNGKREDFVCRVALTGDS